MNRTASDFGVVGVMKSIDWVQFCPYRCGTPTRPSRLAPNTAAATTAATATTVPASALRTGTAVRPRPGSSAIRTPIPPVSDPAMPSAEPSREARTGLGGSATPRGLAPGPAASQMDGSTSSIGSSTVTARPAPSTARLTSMPGLGSASRAGPIGISGEAAMAIPVPSRPPARVTRPTQSSDAAASVPRLAPSARRIGYSAASMLTWRLSSWARMTSAMSAASPAKMVSATASGRMARCAAAVASARLMMDTVPLVPAGYRRASDRAAAAKAAWLAPGRSRTPA